MIDKKLYKYYYIKKVTITDLLKFFGIWLIMAKIYTPLNFLSNWKPSRVAGVDEGLYAYQPKLKLNPLNLYQWSTFLENLTLMACLCG